MSKKQPAFARASARQSKIKLTFIALILVFITTSAFGCKNSISKEEAEKIKPIELTIWRVWDGQDAWADIINKYQSIHPNIKINYKKLRYEEYERELLEALADGRGPDIFSLHGEWVSRYKNKIEPMPKEITMAYTTTKGSIQKEEVVELKKLKSLNVKDIKKDFVDVVHDKIIIDEQIYGLPMGVDTLALFYNRDLLNSKSVLNVPQYWNEEFLADVKKLTKTNSSGDIIQSGIALGTSNNVERYSDILSVLMMQNGAQMINDNNQITFHTRPVGWEKPAVPGVEALRFYNDFANPVKEIYTWNNNMPSSFEAFAQGRLAMFFGYSYHVPMLKVKSPRLNFGVNPMLQIEGGGSQINFANFWVESVSKQSEHINEAWDFVQFATKAENIMSYLDKTGKPSALRSVLANQIESEDENLSVFASQVANARTWYQGKDYNGAEVIMGDMIEQALVSTEDKELLEIMRLSASKIQQTIY